jgi:hypothetical protein
MVGWVTHVHDKVFIGFGPYVECDHCHNKGWLEIWQPFFQQWAYSVIPTPKMYYDFTMFCKICHWGIKIKKKRRPDVAEVLEQGKTATKYAFDRMDARGKERLLKNLNRNGFNSIAAFLSFGDQVSPGFNKNIGQLGREK